MQCDTLRIVLAIKRLDDVLSDVRQSRIDWLSPSEQQRFNSFSSGSRREQFLCGRFLAREAIGCYHIKPWHSFYLTAPDEGAPRVTEQSVAGEMDATFISISHTDGWVACTVSERPVGVDVQSRNKPRDIAGLSKMIDCDLSREKDFSAQMLNRLFYSTWGLREAWIKQSSPTSSLSPPRFVPSHEEDCESGLVSDLGDATLALYPARLDSIELAPESVLVSAWTHWHPMRG